MNRIYIISISALVGLICICSCRKNIGQEQWEDPARYVNPFIGNADNGHTFPGACVPFGMIQVSPETGNGSWRYCSGYNFEDDSIMGFAQNHLNGTGCPDLGDILMLPFSGKNEINRYKSIYNKSTQQASPGYYKVNLSDFNVDVELTATQRTAFHRYVYNDNGPARLLLDLQSGVVSSEYAIKNHVLNAEIHMPDDHTITGHHEVWMWVRRHFFYAIKFDKPYIVKEELPAHEGEKAKRLILEFDIEPGEAVQLKVSLSTVSEDGALASLAEENPGWDFERVKENAHKSWNKLLSRIKVAGTEEEKTNFYTSLYHLCIQPNDISDTDGRYRGVNDSVFTASGGPYYSTLSLWDTYRAAHPLYTIFVPERVDGMVCSMLDHARIQRYLPIWTLWGKENYCMIGNHAIPVIVDAYLKGFRGFDVDATYQAIKKSSTISHPKSDWDIYMKYGYYPCDLVPEESVSRTLESGYDDYCVAQMANALGKREDYDYFLKRSGFYKNLFDPETKLMRGKDSQGNWRTPFDAFVLSHAGTAGGDYTEGNAWQYTWHVQHDIETLIDLMGGKTFFAAKLDSLFFLESKVENKGFTSDVTGLIGQYAHGNEPSHHVAYLYNYAGQPWKTQQLIREIIDRFYLPEPEGLCGNDDCGQMSAWYIFSVMGFYPVDPVCGEYVLGAPQLPEVSLCLPDDRIFTIKARNLSKENKYVQSVRLNGELLPGFTISHQEIMQGGVLEFVMTDIPQKKVDV